MMCNCFHTSDAKAGKQEGAVLHLPSYFCMSKWKHLFKTTLFVPKKKQRECREVPNQATKEKLGQHQPRGIVVHLFMDDF